jgi:hypothetical protein
MNAHPADPTVDTVAVEATVEVAAVEDTAEIVVVPAEIVVDATRISNRLLEALLLQEKK